MAALPDAIKVYIVQSLACFDTISRVAKAVREEFGVEVSPQQCERYDPTKRAGSTLSKKYREIFERTREEFLKDTSRIGVSHRAVRLRALDRAVGIAEQRGNLTLMAQLLEQAAKEAGDAFGARRPALGTQLPHDTRTAVAAAAGTMNGGDLGVQHGIGQCPPTWLPAAPLAIAAARHTQNPAKPTYAVLVAMCVNPGVPHRDPFAKYAVAFRRISISSFALASSLRRRLFSASRSLNGRRLELDALDASPVAACALPSR